MSPPSFDMPSVSLDTWNQFIAARPHAHILQTGAWGELKSRFGWSAVRLIAGESGIQILFRKLPLGFTIAYAPKPLADYEMLLPEIDSVCRAHRAIFLKLETDEWESTSSVLGPPSFVVSPHNIQPPRTIMINLRGTADEILARMKQKCRYNIRLAEKKGVTVRAWNDLAGFHQLMTVTGGRDGFGVHSLDYYQRAYDLFHPTGEVELLVAEYEGKPLAALMVFARGPRSWYLYGASNDEERNRMPTYLLQWEAMKWAKARGCEEYDLWGVPDEDESKLEAEFESRHDGLWGVYRFKRGFGGEVKRAAQAVDRIYMPLLYKAYLKFLGNRE
jgi:lipid II:glycine glycyltransferase (peptidoglycan interpeptide bridge formation enzyme)